MVRCVDVPLMARSAIIASIHSADLAPVLAPAAIADISAPVPAPGRCAVSGSRTLPHPSYARMGRIGRRLAFSCLSYREGVRRAGEPLQEGGLQAAARAARLLRELQEAESRGAAPLEAEESLHTPARCSVFPSPGTSYVDVTPSVVFLPQCDTQRHPWSYPHL
jgi:hypothetical protein